MSETIHRLAQSSGLWTSMTCTDGNTCLVTIQVAANIAIVLSAGIALVPLWHAKRHRGHPVAGQLQNLGSALVLSYAVVSLLDLPLPWPLPWPNANAARTLSQAAAAILSALMAYRLAVQMPRLRWIADALSTPSAQDENLQLTAGQHTLEQMADELRQATEALRVSERRRRALAESRGAVLWRIDEHGRTIEGFGWHSLTGQHDSALLDGSWVERLHPDDLPAIEAARGACLASGEPLAIEHRLRAPDNESWLWVHTQIVPIFDDRNHIVEWLGSIDNITKQRQAEEQIRASEAILRFCMEEGRTGTFQRDRVTGHILCGPETRSLHGLPMDDAPIPLEVWERTVLPDDRKRVQAEMAEVSAQRRSSAVFTYRIRHPVKGDVRHIEVRARYSWNDNGPIVSYGAVVDMTKTREANTMLRLCLEAGRIGEFRYDMAEGTVHGGSETRAMFGLPPDQDSMPAADWFDLLIPEDRERIMTESAVLRMRRAAEGTLNYRVYNRLDNRLHHIEARVRYDYGADGQLLSTYGVVIDVTERREAEARIAHLAHHDALTDLPNRVLFHEHLNVALARVQRGDSFAVLCLDLDRFKEVNDTLGHPIGDALLQAVAARLQAELRDADVLARLGGDEFAIIQPGFHQSTDATSLARRLVETVSAPFDIDGNHILVGTSIGIAVAPGDGMTADALMKSADLALYCAKSDGRGCWRFFEAEMNARMQMRRVLELDLRRALAMQEFELFYQPIVDVATRQVRGLEALIRWRHPERGLVPPDAFIPLAEETGLIVPLGEWVLRRACADAMTWSGARKVAVNLSPAQFASRSLVDVVASALSSSDLPPERLELEITETVMLRDTEATLATLHRLKALGVKIAMDDFGTGYSSLSYLQRFPFDKVKIDRCFTRELGRSPQTNAIVRAIIKLCSGLEMITTAEGVENEQQLQALQRKGCQEAQGYLFSRPRPAAEVAALLLQLEGDPSTMPSGSGDLPSVVRAV